MFNSYEMSQLAQGHYLPLIFGSTYIGSGEIHLTNNKR